MYSVLHVVSVYIFMCMFGDFFSFFEEDEISRGMIGVYVLISREARLPFILPHGYYKKKIIIEKASWYWYVKLISVRERSLLISTSS